MLMDEQALADELRFNGRGNVIEVQDTPRRNEVRLHNRGTGRRGIVAPIIALRPLPAVASWKTHIGRLTSGWVGVGIIARADVVNNTTYNDPTTYMWAGSRQVYIAGQNNAGHMNWDGWQEGDEATLTLNCTARTLSLTRRRNGQAANFLINGLPRREDWRIVLNLYGQGDWVTLSSVAPRPAILELRNAVRVRELERLERAIAVAEALAPEEREAHVAEIQDAGTLMRRLETESKHVRRLRAAMERPDYQELHAAINAAVALQPELADAALDEARAMLADLPGQINRWLTKRLAEDGHELAGIALRALRDAELEALARAVEEHARELVGRCECALARHESVRAVVRELAGVATVLREAERTAAAELRDADDQAANLQALAPQLEELVGTTTERLEAATVALRAAEAAHRQATLDAQRAQADRDANEAATAVAVVTATESREHHASVDTLHRLVMQAHEERAAQLSRANDQLGAAGALTRLQPPELSLLLVELGVCAYIEPLAQHGLDAPALQRSSEAQLRRAVQGTPRSRFGDVRTFRLALESLDRGDGLPPEPRAARPADGAPATWSVEAVRAWLAAQQMEAAAAACAEAHVNGPCLLSMSQEDIFGAFTQLGMADCRRLEEAITELRREQAAACGRQGQPPPAEDATTADVEALGAAVAAALTGGDPCAFPVGYLRRCTNGFAEARLVGEGSFGRVYRAVDPATGVRFAVKRIRSEVPLPQRQAADRSAQRELEVLSTTRHPNMIRLLGHCIAPPSVPGGADGEVCLVYEYGTHGSLAHCLTDDASAASLGWKARVRLATRLSSVLNYLHRHTTPPVYHRDVKAANVVLCDGFEPKLIDCGLAKLLSAEQADQHAAGRTVFTLGTTVAQALGTTGYQCPQYLANPRQYGDRNEVFSFGVVLLELLIGRLNASAEPWLSRRFVNHDMLLETEEEEELTAAALDTRPGRCPNELAAPLIALAQQCLGPLRRRKPMREVLGVLRGLEQEHCELTLDEVQGRLAGATAQAQALAAARAEERQRAREARAAAEAAQRAAEAANRRECCVCFDEVNHAAGVECHGRPAHFLCDGCFAQHCLTASQAELHAITARGGRLFCPERRKEGGAWQCCADRAPPDFPPDLAFTAETVAAHVPPAVFEAYLHARDRIQEQTLVQELEQQFEERMAAERRRVQQLRAEELRVEQTVRHIQESILVLKCPRCEAAFVDFDGCFALTCHRCRCAFCAYCLADCGGDAHAHVAACPHRLQDGYGGDRRTFDRAQQQRRQRMVRDYLATVDQGIRERVIAACARDFADLGLAER